MKKESLVFALSGAFFGLLIGWIIGTQQAAPFPSPSAVAAPPPQQQQTASTPQPAGGSGQRAVLDDGRVRQMEAIAQQQPGDAAVRTQLGNMYFDAGRFPEAIRWYEQAFALNPKDPNVSTDLGVSYYYTNQPDKAIAQFEKSLQADPKHLKTMLNMGIVRAFGLQDLEGAARAWEEVIKVAPDSQEARAAKQSLESMRSAHPVDGKGTD
jgi:tetratricopeptide (TPR) repeat protein